MSLCSCYSESTDESETDDNDGDGEKKSRRLTPEERLIAVQHIDSRLTALSYLYTNHAIHKYFRKYAAEKKPDGMSAVSSAQAVQMTSEVASYLDVPAAIFCQVPVLFQRFNFDGSGVLDKQECTTLFRKILRQKRKDLQGKTLDIDVPYALVAEKGYTIERELGRGGQGIMYLCSKENESKSYCLKFFNKAADGQDNDDLEDLINEYALMKKLNNDHVAQTYEVFQDSQHFYLVNEPYFGGDLTTLAKRAHDEGLSMSEDWWRKIFWQCLDGLRYLHSEAIMHCDIKEENMMLKDAESYQQPHVVLIDFGLAEAFASTSSGASGTAGYIPPETYDTGWWYPRGDVFSMGICFFQLMIGKVPNGSTMGILQTDGDEEADKAAANRLQLPWDRFPQEMPSLQDLVGHMTCRNFMDRPSATQSLQHAWFASQSDAELPAKSRASLLGCSTWQCMQEQMMQEVAKSNNLQELRALHDELTAVDASCSGSVSAEYIKTLLRKYHVRRGCVREYIKACADTNGNVPYSQVIAESIRLKLDYAHHFIHDMFKELDTDNSGYLSTKQIELLLQSDAFECPHEDLDGLMSEMDTDRDGSVSIGEFTEALLKDGRIARRSQVVVKQRGLASCSPACTACAIA